MANSGIDKDGDVVIVNAGPWGGLSFSDLPDSAACVEALTNDSFKRVFPFDSLVVPVLPRQTVNIAELALSSSSSRAFISGMRSVAEVVSRYKRDDPEFFSKEDFLADAEKAIRIAPGQGSFRCPQRLDSFTRSDVEDLAGDMHTAYLRAYSLIDVIEQLELGGENPDETSRGVVEVSTDSFFASQSGSSSSSRSSSSSSGSSGSEDGCVTPPGEVSCSC